MSVSLVSFGLVSVMGVIAPVYATFNFSKRSSPTHAAVGNFMQINFALHHIHHGLL